VDDDRVTSIESSIVRDRRIIISMNQVAKWCRQRQHKKGNKDDRHKVEREGRTRDVESLAVARQETAVRCHIRYSVPLIGLQQKGWLSETCVTNDERERNGDR